MHELVERQHTEKCFEAINAERRNRDNTEVSLSLQFLACNLWSLDHKAALPGDSASPEPRHCSYSLASPASSISWCPRGPHLAPIHHSLLGYCKRAQQVCHLLLITGARQGTFTEDMLYTKHHLTFIMATKLFTVVFQHYVNGFRISESVLHEVTQPGELEMEPDCS